MSNDSAPSFGAIDLLLLLGGGILLIPAATLWLGSSHIDLGLGTGLGILLAFCGIVPAVLDRTLPPAVRHAYNLHYAALAGLASAWWLFGLFGYISDRGLLVELALAGTIGCGPIVLAHLLASIAPIPRQAALVAAIVTCATLALLHTGGPIGAIVFAVGAIALSASLESGASPAGLKPSGGWAALSYAWFNIVAVVGLLPTLLVVFYTQYQMFSNGGITAGDFAPVSPLPSSGGVLETVVARIVFAFIAMLVSGAAVYLWPKRASSRVRRIMTISFVAIAALTMQQPNGERASIAFTIALAAMVFASAGAAHVPRGSRFPWALIVAAIAATIAMQARAPMPESPLLGSAACFFEAAVLAIVWIVAYFFGIRKLQPVFSFAAKTPLPEPPIATES